MNTGRRIAIVAEAILLLATRTQAIAAGRPLVVVGLFTRQGRSSCPSTNANLIKPTGATDVLTLNMRDAMIGAALSAPRSETAA